MEPFQYVTDEMNGHSQASFRFLTPQATYRVKNRTLPILSNRVRYASPKFFRYEGLVTRAYGAIVELKCTSMDSCL